MAKPIVHLYTRYNPKLPSLECKFARQYLKELIDGRQCDGAEFNLDVLPRDHFAQAEARRKGYSHLPTFIVKHPLGRVEDKKIWANNEENWNNGTVRKEVAAALAVVQAVP